MKFCSSTYYDHIDPIVSVKMPPSKPAAYPEGCLIPFMVKAAFAATASLEPNALILGFINSTIHLRSYIYELGKQLLWLRRYIALLGSVTSQPEIAGEQIEAYSHYVTLTTAPLGSLSSTWTPDVCFGCQGLANIY